MNGRDYFHGHAKLRSARRNMYSQFGEDGVVDFILAAIGTDNHFAFECGGADGVMFSNTRRLLGRAWNVAMAEADAAYEPALKRLAEKYPHFFQFSITTLPPHRLDDCLDGFGSPPCPALVCLDIDGLDWHLWNGMIRHFPRVVVIEHSFDPAWDDRIPDLDEPTLGQAGPHAIMRLAASKGYDVVARTLTNSICVRADLMPAFNQALEQKT